MMNHSKIKYSIFILLPLFCLFIKINIAEAESKKSEGRFSYRLSSSESSFVHFSLDSFFNALKNGDTTIINSYLSAALSKKKKAVAAQSDYGAFLREYYVDSSFKVVDIKNNKGGQLHVMITISFGSGSEKNFSLFLDPVTNHKGKKNKVSIYRISSHTEPGENQLQ